jgi:hypothetical protein
LSANSKLALVADFLRGVPWNFLRVCWEHPANKKKITNESVSLLCIRENAFSKVKDTAQLKVFSNSEFKMAILFELSHVDKLVSEIQKHPESKFRVYVFSLANEDLEEELSVFGDRVQSLPVPEGILNNYYRTLGEIRKRP